MNKSNLVDDIATQLNQLSAEDVEIAVKAILRQMSDALAAGDRIEIRGFGNFSLHSYRSRIGRNPKTGEAVAIPAKNVPRFRPSKELKDPLNAAIE